MNQEVLRRARAEEFWMKHLIETAPPGAATFFGGVHLRDEEGVTTVRTGMDPEDVKRVAALCNGSDVLEYNFYATVLGVLLSFYEEEFVFLSPLGGFGHARESDELFFLRPACGRSESFKTLFSGNKQQLLDATAHALSGAALQDLFRGRGGLEAITQFGLVVGKAAQSQLPHRVKTLFGVRLDAPGPLLEIQQRGALYQPGLLQLVGENFNALLKQILSNTYEPVGRLDFRGAAERAVLDGLTSAESYFPLDQNIVARINQQCRLHESKVALVHGRQQLTYGALFRQSNRLSGYLMQGYGAGKDDLFGIMMPRSVALVTSILAVWKAGSAYVPIGVDLPDENLAQIIDNSGFKAIITDNDAVRAQLARVGAGVPVIHLRDVKARVDSQADTCPEVAVAPGDLAYVIYTSGSTGKPKGVMIEHLGMLNHLGAKIHEMSICADSVVAQNAPHTFDISVWQMFSPLVAGATCVIYGNELIADAGDFVAGIQQDRVTVLELVPSYLLEMLHHLEHDQRTALALKVLILNAETLTRPMVERWLSLYPHIPIINTYGATEVSDDTSHYFMTTPPQSYSVPVMKKPIQHFELHLVDEQLRRVPVGVSGIILLAGPCVGRGYFNDEERTKEAFLTGPLEGVTAQPRIYRTGDLGRFMPDGTLEFIGRNDNQVKIRGHRIELDALENIVAALPGVHNAKAVAHVDKQFIALYYLSEATLERTYLEGELLKKLPAYMLPAVYVRMDHFPLTKNGKIDKKALPDPERYRDSEAKAYAAPENELEEKLAAIWQSVLEVDRVGATGNFFELGGHSLKLMRLKNEYHAHFGVKIPIKAFFENPVLRSHAGLIATAEKAVLPQMEQAAEANSYALSEGQTSLWMLSQLEEAAAAYNMPYQVQLNESYDIEVFAKAVFATIERHEMLRTVFKPDPTGEVRQWVLAPEAVPFRIDYQDFRQETDPGQCVTSYIQRDAHQPFDLAQGPLFRAALLRVADHHHVLSYNMHHLVGDAWSTKVLVRDVLAYYEAFRQGIAPGLPPLKRQYKDYVRWEAAAEAHQESHRAYWLNELSGNLPLLDLPGQRPRPSVKQYNGYTLGAFVSAEDTAQLKRFCNSQGGSLFMGVLTAWNILFHKLTGQTDFVVGTPVLGRDHADLKDQIGYYMNTLALRNQVDPESNFLDSFNQLRAATLLHYDHQAYPFSRLVDALQVKRTSNRNPVYDVMLSFHQILERSSAVPVENTDQIQELGEEKSKLDLLINVAEQGKHLYLIVNFDSDLYDKAVIKRLINSYRTILHNLLKNPFDCIRNIAYQAALGQDYKNKNLLKLKTIRPQRV